MLRGSSAARENYGAPVEKLCWSCLSPTLDLIHPPCPLHLKLLGSSMALLLRKLLMLPFSGRRCTRLLRLFWPVFFSFFFLSFFCLFQTCHLPLPSVSSDLFHSLYYLELCQVPCLPLCISISSLRPSLIRSDEALWRNVIFSIIKKKLKIKTWILSAMFGEGARKHWENNQCEESNPPGQNGRARENPGRHRHFVLSRPGLAFTASSCIAWQVAGDRWHLLERARLRFHWRKRSAPSKARPTMLAFTS